MAENGKAIKTVSVKMSEEFYDWLSGRSESERISIPSLIERALVRDAELDNYKAKAPKRSIR